MDTTITMERREIREILNLAMFAGRVVLNYNGQHSVEEKMLANYVWTLVRANNIEDLIELAQERAEIIEKKSL